MDDHSDPHNPHNQIVPRFSSENVNVTECYLNGAIDSQDFDSNFKLNIRPRTVLPFERQKLDFRPALQPLVGSPVDPPKPTPPGTAPPSPSPVSPTVVTSVLGAELKDLEAVIAQQSFTITEMEIEIQRLKTTRRLLSNLVGSFCAYYRYMNAHLFE